MLDTGTEGELNTIGCSAASHTLPFKFAVSTIFLKKITFLCSKDELNRSKVTVKTFIFEIEI